MTDFILGYTGQQVQDTLDEVYKIKNDIEYQTPTVVGTEIRLSKQSDTSVLKFYLSMELTGGAITISTDSGATSTPLVEEDGTTVVTSLDVGLYEVVYATSFFILKSKGTPEAIYGKRDGAEITLVNSKGQPVIIKQGEYAYMNETVALFLTSPIETIYDRTTPVQVVGSAYSTGGNGGRKLVRLDNGNLVGISKELYNGGANVRARFHLSQNNGESWSEICNYGNIKPTSDISIVTDGVNIIALFGGIVTSGSDFRAMSVKFNPLTVPSGAVTGIKYIDTTAQTDIGGCSLAIDSNGHLHATWSSKNATYPNSFNIRYSKSTDGGATWATPTQITTSNTTGHYQQNPSIVIHQNGYVGIVHVFYNGSNYYIDYKQWNGSTWISYRVYGGVAYEQSNPSATVDSNGVIHVVWVSTNTSGYLTIAYSKSIDNGVTWSDIVRIVESTSLNVQNPSIACDLNNDLHVMCGGRITGQANNQMVYVKTISSVWQTPTATTTFSTNYTISPSVCNNYRNFEKPLTIFNSTDVKFYGKWTESNSPQIIPSLATATSESELQAVGEGTLKSFGSTDKFYVGYHSKVSNGFTPL